jgi:hypothetical protein
MFFTEVFFVATSFFLAGFSFFLLAQEFYTHENKVSRAFSRVFPYPIHLRVNGNQMYESDGIHGISLSSL